MTIMSEASKVSCSLNCWALFLGSFSGSYQSESPHLQGIYMFLDHRSRLYLTPRCYQVSAMSPSIIIVWIIEAQLNLLQKKCTAGNRPKRSIVTEGSCGWATERAEG